MSDENQSKTDHLGEKGEGGEGGEKGFTIVDKRSFDTDGEERELKDQVEATPEEPAEKEPETAASRDDPQMPQIDFVTFVLSLYHSVGCHLGQAPNPETKTCEENLPLAKESIDILGMLQEKTQGNLTGEEERILSEVLFNLRMAYIKASGG